MDIKGQWYGSSTEDGTGVRLDLDRRVKGWGGSAYVVAPPGRGPSATYAVSLFDTGDNSIFVGHADYRSSFDAERNGYVPIEAGANQASLHLKVDAELIDNRTLRVKYADETVQGQLSLFRTEVGPESEVGEVRMSWKDYKEAVLTPSTEGRIFRGQQKPWPLTTTFHRTSRTDIFRYSEADVRELAFALRAHYDRQFNLQDPADYASVIALAQHHGMPTPLLDWTLSPYVAAYFAVRDAAVDGTGRPTIFSFAASEWKSRFSEAQDINSPMPSLAILRPAPLGNPRQPVQQSVFVYTNMLNPEHLVLQRGREQGVEFLQRFTIMDPPRTVMKDLRLMGLHAASMFPGMDGLCRSVFESGLEFQE